MPERQTERKRGLSVRKTPHAEEISIAGLRAQYDTHARESYDKLSEILICLNEEKDPGERGSLYRFLNTLLSFSLMPEEKEHILEEE